MVKNRIDIKGMEFYAYHGCFKSEQTVGNKFLVDICLETDCQKALQTDNLKNALNYQTAYKLIKKEMQQNSRLLENIAGRILDALFRHFLQLQQATVTVSKINPPMGGKIREVSVTLMRKKNE